MVEFGDLYQYIVHGESVYIKDKFRNYKALNSFNYFNNGEVKKIDIQNKNLHICIVTCDVHASQTFRIHHRPWVIIAANGMIHSGHCTYMEG